MGWSLIGLPLCELPALVEHRRSFALCALLLYCCGKRCKRFIARFGELLVPELLRQLLQPKAAGLAGSGQIDKVVS